MTASDVDSDLVRKLAALLEETGLTEIEYATDSWRIRVVRSAGSAPAATPVTNPAAAANNPVPAASPGNSAPAQAASTMEVEESHPGAVTSPMVGIVYITPEPGAAPFIKVGDAVEEGQTLLLIEAMKTFNEVRAQRTGKVSQILVEDGAPVEYGEELLILE
ncbi:MAG: acetyl-CoA carboxylase biotin carboxyl carrier protein [Alphaproteobacteria bacterium]